MIHLHTPTAVKQAATTSFPHVFTSPFSYPDKGCDPTAPKHLPRTRTNPPAQRGSLTSVLYPVTPMYYNLQRKTTENVLPHKQRAYPAVPTWQLALVVAFQKVASLSKSNFAFRLMFGRCFFCDSVFWKTVSQRLVGSSGGPFGWCCFPPPLGRGAFSPAPFGPVFFFWEPAPPKGGGGRQHDQKREGNFSLPSFFWAVVPSPYCCDPLLLLVVLPPSFGWCFLPLRSLGGAAVPLFSVK